MLTLRPFTTTGTCTLIRQCTLTIRLCLEAPLRQISLVLHEKKLGNIKTFCYNYIY